jgi:IrrE N-terminal-like domain
MTPTIPTVLGTPAEEARRMLAAHWDDRLPVDPKAIARAAGADLQPILGSQGFSGYFERRDAQTGRPAIHFNPKDALVRQRFTIAHELGHMALGHDDAPRDDPEMFRSGVRSPIERHANQFAAELLMPESAVRRMIASGKFTSVEELAAAFGVSGAAMSFRVGNLNLGLR